MKRKGQYLAIESVLTISIGLAVAIGSITLFSNYRDNVLETGKNEQIDIVQTKVTQAIYNLENVDSGEKTVNLPEEIGNQQYRVILENGVLLTSKDEEIYSNRFNNLVNQYSFEGQAPGGPVKIFKRENEYILRPE